MPTFPLTSGRTATVCASLLDLPAERILRYQCALSPETSADEAFEARFEQQRPRPAAGDTLGQLTRTARLAVYEATPAARGLVVLITATDGVPVTDFWAEALRDRLGWLLTCGLTDVQVQQQQARVEEELRMLSVPYLVAQPGTEAQAIETAVRLQRRVLAMCDFVLGVAAEPLASQAQVTQALLDLLEPAGSVPEESGLSPTVRQGSFTALCHLLSPQQPDPSQLPLRDFLQQVQLVSQHLPA